LRGNQQRSWQARRYKGTGEVGDRTGRPAKDAKAWTGGPPRAVPAELKESEGFGTFPKDGVSETDGTSRQAFPGVGG